MDRLSLKRGVFFPVLWVCLALTGCRPAAPLPTHPPVSPEPLATVELVLVVEVAAATLPPSPPAPPTPTLAISATFSPTPTPQPTLTPTSTPDLYSPYTIAALTARSYGGGEIEIAAVIDENEQAKQYIFTYPSDGLTIYGYMAVPTEGTRFPVAIVVHGYIPPDEYQIIPYTRRYVDALVAAGFFVFHPNLRNFPPSDSGENHFRVGYALDLLNLIAIIKEQSQNPYGPLRRADGDQIHLMGHSMGGGAALRAVTIWPEAARSLVLYGSMSGDEVLNYQQIQQWTNGQTGHFELAAPPEMLAAISPIYHLSRLTLPISIHHSMDDQVVPYAWSEQLCAALQAINHPVECFTYSRVPHTFYGAADQLFQERIIAFFQRH